MDAFRTGNAAFVIAVAGGAGAAEDRVAILLQPVGEGIISLECLTVNGHEKKGKYVSSHIHHNVTYLLRAGDEDLQEKPDENSGVAWFTPEEALAASTEPWMVERVYRKLNERAKPFMKSDRESAGTTV